MKQSPCFWCQKLNKTVENFGFKQWDYLHCIFMLNDNTFEDFISIDVDDFMILSPDMEGIERVKELKQLVQASGLG